MLLFPAAASADEDDRLSPCVDLLQTADAGSPCVVEPKRAIVQFSISREREDQTRIVYPSAVIRFGVRDGAEIHVVLPSLQRTVGVSGARSTDVGLGLKQIIASGRGALAFVADATLPTGAGDASGGLPTWRGGFSGSYAVTRRVNLIATLAVARGLLDGTERSTRFTKAAGVEFEPWEGTEFDLEVVKDGPRLSETEASLQRLLRPNLAVRLGLARGSSPDARSSSVSLGVTLRI